MSRSIQTGDGDEGDAHFLKQSIIHDHFDASQCERFRNEHRRLVSFFRSSRVGELFGVVPASGFRWNA